jgi:hypothetical protein
MAYNLLVVFGLLMMAGSVWLQAAWVVVSTEDAIRKQQLYMLASQVLIGVGSALVTQACHGSLLGASQHQNSEQL